MPDPIDPSNPFEALLKQLSAATTATESEVPAAKNNDNTINFKVVPVIVIPGVMGTRLEFSDGVQWDPDDPVTMAAHWVTPSVKTLRNRFRAGGAKVLRASTDPLDKGFDALVAGFYLDFLTFLTTAVGSQVTSTGFMPVHAFGYDWTQSNTQSAAALDDAVKSILAGYKAKKAILVTHSMGGIVARAACQTRVGFVDKIAGVVHTAQPVGGASVAYRRFLDGADDNGFLFDKILGNEWWKYMAQMSVLPGPLQLLPTDHYRRIETETDWLFHLQGDHASTAKPSDVPVVRNPILSTYLLHTFPGIVFGFDDSVGDFDESEWLGVMTDLAANLSVAGLFHDTLGLSSHPTTSVMVSTDKPDTEVGVIGTTFDTAPFFASTRMKIAGDRTVPRSSANLLDPTEDGSKVADPEKAAPPRLLVGPLGDHARVLDNSDVRDFVVKNAKYFFQKASAP
jgi:hypothetical protein